MTTMDMRMHDMKTTDGPNGTVWNWRWSWPAVALRPPQVEL